MRSRTQLLIAFCSALTVTLVAVSDMGRTSPGALASVHQRVSALAGRNDCSECHGGLFGTLREACLECHEPIETQLTDGTGLHGTLGARAEQCGLCHAEHHGATAPLVHGQSFALAGVADVARFDHALLGFVLDGAHTALDCTECHPNARVAVLPEGETRYLGLARDCASCHEDPHAGAMLPACADCHGQERWDGLAAPGHERVLPLTGGHALDCAECHAEDGPHALGLVGSERAPTGRDCVACHASPHDEGFLAGVARRTRSAPGQACVECHAPEHTSFHEEELGRLTSTLHAASGFALEEPHAGLDCDRCHDPDGTTFEQRYPGRTAEACSQCHADVHEGQFESGPFAGEECTACHDPRHFEPPAFGPEEHARSAFELDGAHLGVDCEGCHSRPEPDAARVFHGTPAACEACHVDVHAGAFERLAARRAPALPAEPSPGGCAACHDTTRFSDAARDFEHGAFTGFELRGAHAESACETCHARTRTPDESGRSFGRVSALFGEFHGCDSCHPDPHFGFFDLDNGFPTEVEGHSGCTRCHQESSFRALRRPFDHAYWTGFALAGAHAAARCSDCHAPLAEPDPNGRTVADAVGSGCDTCHENPHGSQFADERAVTDCARCHASEPEDFLAFDHERDARFPLGEAHRDLSCDACHHEEREGGLVLVRFRPLAFECVDCHGTGAEVLLRRLPRRK